MNRFLKLSSLLLIPISLIGCGGDAGSKPSEKYSEKFLFQHINITASQSELAVKSEYYSNNHIYLSSNKENQYLTLNGGSRHTLKSRNNKNYSYDEEEYTTYLTAEDLNSNLEYGDDITVIFARFTGNILESKGKIPHFAQYTSPSNNSEIDHENEDLFIEWDIAQSNITTLYIQSECLRASANNRDINGFRFELTSDQRNILIPANTFKKHPLESSNSCEININLYNKADGVNDPDFAGGTFDIQTLSSQKVTLTNLKD